MNRVVAVDWTGRLGGERSHLWAGEAAGGALVALAGGRTRPELVEHLCRLAAADASLVVGLDFSFSLPRWWLAQCGFHSAPTLWAAAAEHGESWLAACHPPWWGRPGRPRPDGPGSDGGGAWQWRATEAALPAVAGIRPKSSFQIGGTGSVGTGSLRGMPFLAGLKAAGFSIWPFDPPRLPVVVEIWPRLLTGPVAKSDPGARRRHLAACHPGLDRRWAGLATSSQDAFDAACSALAMAAHARGLAELPDLSGDPVAALEGRIWAPGP